MGVAPIGFEEGLVPGVKLGVEGAWGNGSGVARGLLR